MLLLFFLRDFFGVCIATPPKKKCPFCFDRKPIITHIKDFPADICDRRQFSIKKASGGQGDLYHGLNQEGFVKCSKTIDIAWTENNACLTDIVRTKAEDREYSKRSTRDDLIREASALYCLNYKRVLKPLGFYDDGNVFFYQLRPVILIF